MAERDEFGVRAGIARALRELRAESGRTQAEVASLTGTTQTAISYWENGTRTPTPDNLVTLAAVYGTDPGAFFAGPAVKRATAEIRRRENSAAAEARRREKRRG